MIKHIFKIIWTEKKINAWILLELILVFCILWFCVDYICYSVRFYFSPKGFDIEHVYTMELGVKEEAIQILKEGNNAQAEDDMFDDLWTLYDRVKRYPDAEAVCMSRAAVPYAGSFVNNMFYLDTLSEAIQVKIVSPEFFDVFKIPILHGKVYDWSMKNDRAVLLSAGSKGTIFGKDPAEIKSIKTKLGDNHEIEGKVVGIAERAKRSEFDDYNSIIFMLPDERDKSLLRWLPEISMRIKPDADKNFIEKFGSGMQEQLSVGSFYLSSIESMTDLRKNYLKWTGTDNSFKSIFSIVGFLIVNIFLAIWGTFWFRIQSRRNEIGLRIAMGSTKTKVQAIFMQETLILIALASLIATLISINIGMTDILKYVNMPVVDRGEEAMKIGQYFINYGITLTILILISIAAVWYPSLQASKIAPAEALKDE